jgi:hypothetical protein
MSDNRTSVEIKPTGPSYVSWRGELLAELALARVPALTVYKRPEKAASDLPYHFLVATEHGLCFFVEVQAFSSFRLDVADVKTIPELRWAVDPDIVRQARASHSPVFLFLFDADSDHGRYLRLDTLPAPRPNTRHVIVRLPAEQAITRENVEKLAAELQGVPAS